MKVKLSGYIPWEVVIDMTPEEYCEFHATGKDATGKNYYPEDIIYEKSEFVSDKDRKELNHFFFSKNKKKG